MSRRRGKGGSEVIGEGGSEVEGDDSKGRTAGESRMMRKMMTIQDGEWRHVDEKKEGGRGEGEKEENSYESEVTRDTKAARFTQTKPG